MPVSVGCPSCGRELLAPDELVGQLAACPQCNTQFPVTSSAASGGGAPRAAGRLPAAEPPVSGASAAANTPPLNLRPAKSMLVPDGAEPPQPQAARATPAAAPAPRGDKAVFYPPGQGPAAADAPAAAPPPTPASPPSPARQEAPAPAAAAPRSATGGRAAAKPHRAAQTARFIAGDTTQTRFQLGQDGQLPALVLDEDSSSESGQVVEKKSNPWLLVAALGVSFSMSALLLFVDLEGSRPEPTSKAEARQQLHEMYLDPERRPGPHQPLLRRALQAHHMGDYAEERRLYKQVLNMLHREGKDPISGLTGEGIDGPAPSDRHLQELLTTLRR